jgi:hypothetical protein
VAKFSERLDSCATTAPAPVTLSAKRTIAPELRQAMIDVLRGEAENRRTVWLEVNLSNPATAAFHGALSGIFKEAGWQVETRTIPGIALKPGVFLTIAEEEPPAWVGTVQQALDASGLEVKSARGYRAFYEAQKTSNPAWSGVRMSPEQQFALIIGPDPG